MELIGSVTVWGVLVGMWGRGGLGGGWEVRQAGPFSTQNLSGVKEQNLKLFNNKG